MVLPNGFQPATTGHERRADFDLLRRVARLEGRGSDTVTYVSDYTSGGAIDATGGLNAAIAAAYAKQQNHAFWPDRRSEVLLDPGTYYSTDPLTLPANVVIKGRGGELRARTGGPIVTLEDGAAIEDVYLRGFTISSGTDVSGVFVPAGAFQWAIRRCWFNQFTGSAINVQGNAGHIEDCFAQNCLTDAATLSVPTGVLHMVPDGTNRCNDNWVRNCELTASRTSMSASGFAYAAVLSGQASVFDGLVCEISDHGLYHNGNYNKFVNCRADLNRGNGFVFDGGGGSVVGCHALNNGRETTNTYSGFRVLDGASPTLHPTYNFTNCRADITTGNTHQYGFNDSSANFGFFPTYTACRSTGHGTRAITVVTIGGGHVRADEGGFYPITAGATTWDVQTTGWPQRNWALSATGATNFTFFSNGVPGMRLTILGDGNSTFVHNTSFLRLKSGANTLAAANTMYEFVWHNGAWYEL